SAKVAERCDGRTLNQTQGLGGASTVGVLAAIQHRLYERPVREVEFGREIGREGAEFDLGRPAPAARAAHVFPDLLPPLTLCPHPPTSFVHECSRRRKAC